MPTIIGAIFFCFAAYFFFFKEDLLFGLLLISCVFEAASAINVGERGIQPYYIVAVFVIARAIVNKLFGIAGNKATPPYKWLLLFGVVAIVSAFISPIIFAGIPIYDPKIGIDDGLFIRPPLRFGLNNIIQSCYLAVHIATAFSLLAIKFSPTKTRRAFLLAFYIEVSFIFAESFCQLAGLSFPLSLVLNNPGYALWENSMEAYGTRNPGTFSEPSLAGVFLTLYCAAFLAQYFSHKGGSAKVVISLLAMGMVASTSSLFAVSLTLVALLISYPPFRAPWYINLSQAKRILWILLLIVTPFVLVLLLSSGFRAVLTTVTVTKGETGSFINRTASDLYSLQLLFQTYGIGVGLGSNRTSSFLSTSLSNIGVLGTLAFVVFCYKLVAGLQEHVWLKWALLAFFLNMAISIADMTIPLFWCPILLALRFSLKEQDRSRKPALQNLRSQEVEHTSISNGVEYCRGLAMCYSE